MDGKTAMMLTALWTPAPLLPLLLILTAVTAGSDVCRALKKYGSTDYQRCDQCVQNCFSHAHRRGRWDPAEGEEDEVEPGAGRQLSRRALCPFTLERRWYGDFSMQVARRAGGGGRCQSLGRFCSELTVEVTYELRHRRQTDAVPVAFVCAAPSDGDAFTIFIAKAATQPSLTRRQRKQHLSEHHGEDQQQQQHQSRQHWESAEGPGHQTTSGQSPQSRHQLTEPGQ